MSNCPEDQESVIHLLWLLIEDLQQRANLIRSEIGDIIQSSNYLVNSSAVGKSGDSSFYSDVKDASEDALEMLKGEHDSLLFQKIAYTLAASEGNDKTVDSAGPDVPNLVRLMGFDRSSTDLIDDLRSSWSRFLTSNSSSQDSSLFSERILDVFAHRSEVMRVLDRVVERTRLCRKALSERIETLRPHVSVPSRFFRKEAKRNLIIIDNISRVYANYVEDFSKKFIFADPECTPELKQVLLFDHCNATQVQYYTPHTNNGDQSATSHILLRGPVWLGEIPRYVPVLCHETSHAVLDYVTRQSAECPGLLSSEFKQLINSLRNRLTIVHFNSRYGFPEGHFHNQIDVMINEMLADILALIIAGPAYLFALIFSAIHGVSVNQFVSTAQELPVFVRIALIKDIAEQLFPLDSRSAKWVHALEYILDAYKKHLASAGKVPKETCEYKLKKEYYEGMIVAFQRPVERYVNHVVRSSEFRKTFMWAEDGRKNRRIRKAVEAHLPQGDQYTASIKNCLLAKETNLARSIPNVLWTAVLESFPLTVQSLEAFTPEGRILRGLHS